VINGVGYKNLRESFATLLGLHTQALGARQRLLIAAVLAAATFLIYAHFQQNPRNANVASRMFLTMSIVGHGELSIDKYAHLTKDKAVSDGRYYTDKAPGLSFLALPITAALWKPVTAADHIYANEIGTSESEGYPKGYYLFSYFATLFTSSLITALAVGAVFLVAFDLFKNPIGAVVSAAAFGLATPAFGWATSFFGHASAMGLLFLGFACLHFVGRSDTDARRNMWLVCGGVAALTWAVITEFTSAPIAAAIALYAAPRVFARPEKAMLIGCAIIAGLLVSSPLFIYNTIAFGAPWKLGYQAVSGFEGMQQGFLGLTSPKLNVIYEITFGLYRGILPLAPVLLLVPVGLFQMLKNKYTSQAALIVFVVLYYLLLNASYYYWDGGWSTGPRHITGMLPFACLALALVWSLAGRGTRLLILALLAVSAGLSALSAAVSMYSPSNFRFPLVEFLLPGLLGGETAAMPVALLGWRVRLFLPFFAISYLCVIVATLYFVGRTVLREHRSSDPVGARMSVAQEPAV
jgi:hypothetical protein